MPILFQSSFCCLLMAVICNQAAVCQGEEATSVAATTASAPHPSDCPGWKLVWNDEFEGDRLNYSQWGIEQNAFGGGNQELQIYTDRSKNVRVENGCLVLEAHRDSAGVSGVNREFSSGRVRTKNRGDWKYGYVEVRAKLPRGQGIWPAIWMLPTGEEYGTWAASGEIDIMEMRGQDPSTVLGTLHYGGTWPNNTHSGDSFQLAEGTFADDFHTFAVDWREGSITWLIDGKPVQTQNRWHSTGGDFPAPFNQPFHLVLNVAVGGGFVGVPDASTQYPQQMLVDYVRVYQSDAPNSSASAIPRGD